MRSNLKEAVTFQDWFVEEVLPSIRKHGAYMTPDTLKKAINDPQYIKTLTLTLIGELEEAKKKIEADAPAVAFVEELKATGDLIYGDQVAKLICTATKLKIGHRKFFNWLRQNGYLFKQAKGFPNVITQKGVDAGYIVSKEELHGGKIAIVPMFTVEGQIFFVNTFCEMKENGFIGFDTTGREMYHRSGAQVLLLDKLGG
jgi:anti-repressor protein